METLVIVKKIRQAEALAAGGDHLEAVRVLEPLLADPALQEAHQVLIRRKIELLERQRQRATRIMARAEESQARDSGESTVMQLANEDRTERPTRTTLETLPEGEPTETVPALPRRARLPLQAETDTGRTPTRRAKHPLPQDETLRVPPPPGTPQTTVMMPAQALFGSDPNDTQQVPKPPGLTESGRQQRVFDEIVPTDTGPVPRFDDDEQDDTPVPTRAEVRDSVVMPGVANVIPTPAPGPPRKRDESGEYLQVDDHFGPPPSPKRLSSQSTPELKTLVQQLPEDDLRRDLAVEVLRLREELDNSRRRPPTGPQPATRRSERPESGKFHIPGGQANTIVRKAAGTDNIEVHMPSRDENMPELQVLRRDSLRGKAVDTANASESAARQYVERASNRRLAVRIRPVLLWLTVLVLLALLGWLAWLAFSALTDNSTVSAVLTEEAVGEIKLGAEIAAVPALQYARHDAEAGTWTTESGLIVQAASETVAAITVPCDSDGRANLGQVMFNGRSFRPDKGTELSRVHAELGESAPPHSEELFRRLPVYSLYWPDRQGRATLEVRYRGGVESGAVALRLFDPARPVPFPELPAAGQ